MGGVRNRSAADWNYGHMIVYVAYLATDGGKDAVALGAQLARTLDAEVAIGMIVPPDNAAAMAPGDFDEVLTAQADGWLSDARDLITDDIPVSTHIGVYDSIAGGIIAEAERVGASIIVAGGSGGGLLGPYSLGSVVNDLLHSAPLPVAIAPRGFRNQGVRTVREVTCALGTRYGAEAVLETAIRGCQRAGVPLRLISLIALDLMPSKRREDSNAVYAAEKHAERLLDEARGRLPGVVEVSSAVATGPSVEDAVRRLDWQPGDVILVGSSRLAAPRRLFLGSTAAKMLRVVAVPMIVVPREI
ncbi:UspA domain protein OS=Tsukamurella paurometabola (strain ATCC 8368 / DSM / CCUG 35730 / CIP 100753 / JCM 10117 / KCTC 9821 / NBRC 16120 / NCIMB 702349/ NCTC 13040) OX=521096 GN=Tpau_1225 PE=4 SV=1 [Tsukamurella paurometabola]|uniref:UspA domain protein n=2 Tax=Tsukamurella paurometabola TaxID=2061 RepID=D5UW49_TSUPD|nr:UspA domain protein [Tsukamurella paurometabola DSM 20162]SUP29069.1 Universal stress protein family [Tsukamurella paurometabola]